MTKEAMIFQTWKRLCRKADFMPTPRDLNNLPILLESYGEYQAKWIICRYDLEDPLPTISKFSEWLSKNFSGDLPENLPEELSCAAYLTEEPEVIRLADQLETLEGAWFPDESTIEQVKELRRKLTEALL